MWRYVIRIFNLKYSFSNNIINKTVYFYKISIRKIINNDFTCVKCIPAYTNNYICCLYIYIAYTNNAEFKILIRKCFSQFIQTCLLLRMFVTEKKNYI